MANTDEYNASKNVKLKKHFHSLSTELTNGFCHAMMVFISVTYLVLPLARTIKIREL